MNIKLAYGAEQLPIDVPDNWINGRCYRPRPLAPCADQRAELMAALQGLPEEMHLRHLAADKSTCTIAVDGENPSVMEELLPALVEIIEDETEISSGNLTILIANRILQPLRKADLPNLLSEELQRHYRTVLHDPWDTKMVRSAGHSPTRKIPLLLNRHYLDADFKVILGGVRPDVLYGFTGGRCVVLPGLAGRETLKALYDFDQVSNRNARFGNFRDNPFHITAIEATNAVGCDLAISAALTPRSQVSKLFVGHFGQSHIQAMNALRDSMVVKVKEPMDIVVTSGGGAPYDNNLLNVLATICSVEPVLKADGTIVIAAQLKEGYGPAGFADLIKNHRSLSETMEWLQREDRFIPGQWIAQRFFQILRDHEVILYNKEIAEEEIWAAGMTPTRDMNEAILGAMESHGQRCKIVALPDGPMGIGEVG